MTLNDTLRRPSRSRQTTLGLVLASVVLGGTLTACGSDAENTTCGELKAKNTDETIEFVKDAAKDDGGDNADDTLKVIESIGDNKEQKAQLEKTVKALCDGKDDDTKLKDTSFYE